MKYPTKDTTNTTNTHKDHQQDDEKTEQKDVTASSPPALKLKKVVPEIVSKEMNQKYQKGLEKQRQILANLIFPSHIPGPCHPNVSSLVEVIRDLQEVSTTRKESQSNSSSSGIGDSSASSSKESKNPTSFSAKDIENLRLNSIGTTSLVTPLQEIRNVHEKCDVYLRRAKHYETLAKKQQQQQQQQQQRSENKSTQNKNNTLLEMVSMSKIFQMNYRYCIASVSCPQRVAVLNHCYSQYPPEVVQASVKAGQHEYICTKERKAVERCCGQNVQSLIRNMQERSR